MRLENTITRFKNLTLSNLVELDLESKISSVTRLQCLKVSFTIKSLKKHKKSKESRTSEQKELKTKFSVESVGVLRKILKTH